MAAQDDPRFDAVRRVTDAIAEFDRTTRAARSARRAAASRRVVMPNPVRRESRDGRMLNWYATAQDAADAELLLRETGQLDRESAAPLGRVEAEDADGQYAVAS